MRAAVLVSGRRWDLYLDDGVTIKLPEKNLRAALAQLVRLDAEQQLLARDVIVVDLRLPDRITVRLPEGRSLDDVTSDGAAPTSQPRKGPHVKSGGEHQPSGVSRVKPLGSRRSTFVSVLDVGSTKICCLIARLKPREGETLRRRTHSVEVLGFASTRSRGIKSGVVVDLDEAEQAIRLAVDGAERMAEMTVGSLIVNLSCGRLKSETFSASVKVGGTVAEADIQRVLGAGGAHSVSDGRMVLHSLPDRLCARRQSRHPRPDRHAGRDARRRHARRHRRGGAAPEPRAGDQPLPPGESRRWSRRPTRRAWRRWSTTRRSSASR